MQQYSYCSKRLFHMETQKENQHFPEPLRGEDGGFTKTSILQRLPSILQQMIMDNEFSKDILEVTVICKRWLLIQLKQVQTLKHNIETNGKPTPIIKVSNSSSLYVPFNQNRNTRKKLILAPGIMHLFMISITCLFHGSYC
jgi:hypothetical protein